MISETVATLLGGGLGSLLYVWWQRQPRPSQHCGRCGRPPHSDRLHLDCLRYTPERLSEPLRPPDPLLDYQPRSLEREWAEQVLARGLAEEADKRRKAILRARIVACDHENVEKIEMTSFGEWPPWFLYQCPDCGGSNTDLAPIFDNSRKSALP